MKTHITTSPKRGSKLLTAIFLVVVIGGGIGAAVFWSDQPRLIEHVSKRDHLAVPSAIVLRWQGPPPDARQPLLAALEHGEPRLRAAAARALGKYKARDLVNDLGRAALSDVDPGVRAAAFEGLDVTGDSSAVTFVRRGLEDENNEVKAAACGAVAGVLMYDCIPILIEFLESHDVTVRLGAKRALDRFLPAGQESFDMSRPSWTSWYESLRR